MKQIIAVDIGTTHTKAVLVNVEAKVLLEEKTSYATYSPAPGYSEQEPDDVLNAVCQVLEKVFTAVPDKENITAVCFSAAMHSVIAVDEAGKPLMPAMIWADTRSHHYARKLKESGKGQEIYIKTGTPIHPMSPLCKIAWIRDELPEIFGKTSRFISIKEYIFFHLFGTFLVDYSIASATGLFDIHTLQWNPESLEFAGISTGHLSDPVSPAHSERGLREDFRKRFGIEEEVPFFIGSSDGCLAILGSGAIRPDEAALTVGTSAALRMITRHPTPQPGGNLFNYVIDKDLYVTGGASNNGGNVLKWFSENLLDRPFASAESFTWFTDTASRSSIGAEGLIFLPYIQGERAPVWDASARGVFVGVHGGHTKEHFMRAIMEGICYSLYQVLNDMEEGGSSIDIIHASGGFIQSVTWLQMLSDIFNKKVIVSLAADASAMGAAFLAMHSLGIITEWDEVKGMVETSDTYCPAEDAHERYQRNFKVFKGLYSKLKDDMAVLSAMA